MVSMAPGSSLRSTNATPSLASLHGSTSTGSFVPHSADQSVCMRLHEPQQRRLRPIAIVAGCGMGVAKKSAVPPMLSLYERDVRVGSNRSGRLRRQYDERIVQSMQDQRRDRDAVNHARGCGAIVIVLGR